MAYIDNTSHIPQFGGDIWYVNKGSGSDTNSGRKPSNAFETIGAAISAMSDGDAIVIKAGTYTETGLTLSNNFAEMWFEIGAVLDPASGTCLTVSGNSCRVTCREGALKITPGAGETGVLVTGTFCYLAEIRVACLSSGAIGFDIGSADGDQTDGSGADLRNCRCSSPTTAAFKIQANKVRLLDCCTGGDSGDSSIGFWITNSCDKARLKSCGSQGHETAGYQVDSGCTNGVIEDCYSGGGDGKWTDADNSFVWSNFSYERFLFATSTLDGSTTYNLFKITGAIKVYNIFWACYKYYCQYQFNHKPRIILYKCLCRYYRFRRCAKHSS